MVRTVIYIFWVFIMLVSVAYASPKRPEEQGGRDIKDLFLRSALYTAHQQDWFTAIAQINFELVQHFQLDEPNLDLLYEHIDVAQYAFGDFELSYGLYQKAGHALMLLINNVTDVERRNDALYRLAKLQYVKGEFSRAEQTLRRVVPGENHSVAHQVTMLQGQVAMALGRYGDAVDFLAGLAESAPELTGFASYNLGIALLAAGQEEEGIQTLISMSLLDTSDPVIQVLKDKVYQVIGEHALGKGNYSSAKQFFSQVRLDSPYANRALLGSGWASVNLHDYRAALIPWSRLTDQVKTDSSVQEALLGLPYVYAKLGEFSTAAHMYRQALSIYEVQIERLKQSIDSVKQGRLLELLVRPEVVQDKEWLVKLRKLPEAPETYYLLEMMSQHAFNSALQNYIDLHELLNKLETWKKDIEAYREIIAVRRAYYNPVLDSADKKLSDLDSRLNLRLEQRQYISKSLQRLLVTPDHRLLASAEERIASEQLTALEEQIDLIDGADVEGYKQRLYRLQGAIFFAQKVGYPDRLSQAFQNLNDLNDLLEKLQSQYAGYLRIRQAATLSFQNYDDLLTELDQRVSEQLEKILKVITLQGQQLEEMTVAVLENRLDKIKKFQTRARFAMADSYDRAAREPNQE